MLGSGVSRRCLEAVAGVLHDLLGGHTVFLMELQNFVRLFAAHETAGVGELLRAYDEYNNIVESQPSGWTDAQRHIVSIAIYTHG